MVGYNAYLNGLISDQKTPNLRLSDDGFTTRTDACITEIQTDSVKKSLIRKLDIRIIPCLSVLYCFAYLARGNIGNAHLSTFDSDLSLSENQYNLSLCTFYIGYLLFQLPCTLLVKILRPSHVLSGTMIIFGIFSVSVAAAKNATTLIVLRFFLGVFEAAIGPGVPLYLSFWYEREEMAKRVSAYYSFSAVAGALGGLIAYSTFSNLQNVYGLSSWQWLFLIEGIPTIFIGLLSFALLPDYPSTASTKWLTTEEKVLCVERMNVNLEKKDASFDYKQFKEGLKDYKNWMTALISLGLHVPLSSLLFFMPTFVKSMGFSTLTSQLMTMPPYAFAFVAIIVASRTADITMQRGYHIFVLSITAAFGYILVFIPSVWAKYCGTILATVGVYGALPILHAWVADNQYGHTKRATGLALTNMIGQSFSILATQLYRKDDAPDYSRGHSICFTFMIITGATALGLRVLLRRCNDRLDENICNEDGSIEKQQSSKYVL